MSNNCFLEKIKSKFIIERIFEYISDYNEIYKLSFVNIKGVYYFNNIIYIFMSKSENY